MISLQKERYSKLLEPIKSITNNNLFARAVAERVVEGEIFVDNVENPKSFYLLHPYGMSLLFGDSKNKTFNLAFKKYALNENRSRKKVEWMQVFPADWDNAGSYQLAQKLGFENVKEISYYRLGLN